jgi:hypothetical protein
MLPPSKIGRASGVSSDAFRKHCVRFTSSSLTHSPPTLASKCHCPVDSAMMGRPLDVTEVDNTCVTETSFRFCACAGDINNVAKAASRTSFIALSLRQRSIYCGFAISSQMAFTLPGQSARLLTSGTPSQGQTPSCRLLRDLGRGERQIVKILAVLVSHQWTSDFLEGNAMHAPNPTR